MTTDTGPTAATYSHPPEYVRRWNEAQGMYIYTTPQPTDEPHDSLVRYCPSCGSVGEVAAGSRDCCPDGMRARYLPSHIVAHIHRCERENHDLRGLDHPSTIAGLEGLADILRRIEVYAGSIKSKLDHENYFGPHAPEGLKTGPIYEAAERSVFIKNCVAEARAILDRPIPAADTKNIALAPNWSNDQLTASAPFAS